VTKVTATFTDERWKGCEAEVVNPGDDDAHWPSLFWVEDCYDPPVYLVEGHSTDESLDTFLYEAATAKHYQIEPGSPEEDEYFLNVWPGDVIGGVERAEKGRLSLGGRFEPGEHGPEPYCTGGGDYFDIESVNSIEIDPKKVFYHQGDLAPPEGIRADLWRTWQELSDERYGSVQADEEWGTENAILTARACRENPTDRAPFIGLSDVLEQLWGEKPETSPRDDLAPLILSALRMGRLIEIVHDLARMETLAESVEE
jgi:hypothetical protein